MSILQTIRRLLGLDDSARGLLFQLIGVIIFRTLCIDLFWVPTSSEAPNIHRGDLVVVAKWKYGYSPLSLAWNLGYSLMPQSDEKIDFLYGNKEVNDRLVGGKVPYYKHTSVKVGDLITYTDPRSGYGICKRVVAVSGDSIGMDNVHIILNNVQSPWRSLGDFTYVCDDGIPKLHNLFEEDLGGTGIKYTIQVLPDNAKCYRKNDNMVIRKVPDQYKLLNSEMLSADSSMRIKALVYFMSLLNGKDTGQYIVLIGDNRHGSSDSRHGDVIPENLPEEFVTGKAIFILASSYLFFEIAEATRRTPTTWLSWGVALPRRIICTALAVLCCPSRVGLKLN